MSFSPSQFETSGGESGWTMYLDQSQSYSYYPYETECHGRVKEAEDLSMVSDASSGPPHFHGGGGEEEEEEEEECSSASKSKKKAEKKKKQGERSKKKSYLDDTASSPVKSSSKKKTSVSNGQASMQHFSATHSKGSSSFRRQFNFLRSSVPDKPASDRQVDFQGKWE